MGLIIPILIIVFCCIVIWKASDGFETSSEYLGRNMSEGVRGATINAIASSMPELFTTIFFLWFLKDTDGFSGGIGTTAGSAIFNGMIIPAVVIFAVLSSNASTKIEVSKKVILRDGLSLIIAEAILILLISGDTLMWWHGLVLMLTYGAYITYMLTSMEKVDNDDDDDDDDDDDEIESVGFFKGLFTLNLEGLIIGDKEINTKNSWQLLIVSMTIIGCACLLLVVACEFIGADTYTFLGYEFNGLNIPIMFVAVILASAATSVPDTIISVRDAKNGNYNDAVANALGSNIFDICFALGFPLFIYCLIYGPINMDPTVVEFSSELRILLLIFTILAFFVYFIGKYMGKTKAYLLLSMYILFTAYIFGRSLDALWAQDISDVLRNIANLIT
ncbi:MAG: sodium:calcium antiporter [Flavobacteriales bacterium]|nr:sodium:calcium antiporter [Flavobacteriaceae bacterium]MDG2227357.1 sodium:calcium antiporter [Flavobacteriales bacterium]